MASWALRPASRRDPAPDSWRPGRPFRGKVALYWAATGIIVAVLLTGGGADLIRREPTVDGMVALGYPVYFMTFLGTAKVLGAIALSAPRFGRLKEWAYAGAFYNFAGAFTSHLIMGSEAGHVFWTGLFSVLTLVSWALRPSGRVLGFAGAASDTGLRSSSRGASRRPVAPR
ncbi:DoxX family protein [Glycomyces buryatensis]|uniref:DoxX family protein n=2 Tax=Glycomyces buryatensis TaxID=2570927 RepID=A0A4S8PPQ5_9ACTN|nr:DoxX family protein [Glycomyces buryatensis]